MTPGLVAVLRVDDDTDAWVATTKSVRLCHAGLGVLVVGSTAGQREPLEAEGATLVDGGLSDVIGAAWHEQRCHVLVVTGPAGFPPDALVPALAIVENDIRIGTVSFLSNDARFLTLAPPGPAAMPVDGADAVDPEDGITRRLRAARPPAGPAPCPFAAGPAVLVSSYALSAVGPPADAALVEFSVRARARGFLDVVDPSTYVRRLTRARSGASPSTELVDDLVREVGGADSALAVAKGVARAKVWGLRLLIDGSCLGPLEMGTQVQAVALVGALARRPDVASVTVALSGPVPDYAKTMLADAKVEARQATGGDLSGFTEVDVAHQPFQPEGPIDIWAWPDVAARSVVTILDLIAYRSRSYQVTGADWQGYRRRVRRTISLVDGVVAPAHDVGWQIAMEAMTEPDRVFTVPLGADHLDGDEAESPPAGLTGDGAFVLVLGADYTHKNRDLAIRTAGVLRDRGLALRLVLAGVGVHGSSRIEEAAAREATDAEVVVLGDVTSAERNWLLHHAALVLYPSSAEGFGLVPFEAARFGTPSVFVPFGPLRETFGDVPVRATDWSPSALADAAEACLRDPSLAEAQAQAITAVAARYTWDACAAGLVDVYRSVLARPPIRFGGELAQADARCRLLAASRDQAVAELERLRTSPEARLGGRLRAARDSLARARLRLAPERREP